MNAHKLTVHRTAHYYTLGKPSKAITQLWIVCHGLGQVADQFIKDFEVLNDGKTLVIAPEGLNKFYWKGFGGEPLAMWMTSRHRLDEIADYSNYLQQLYDDYVPQLADNVQITLFGFSQGCATVMRYMLRIFPKIHHLVLWAGALPEDIEYLPHLDYLTPIQKVSVCGTRDQYITTERIEAFRAFCQANSLEFTPFLFEGAHVVVGDTVKEVSDFLNK